MTEQTIKRVDFVDHGDDIGMVVHNQIFDGFYVVSINENQDKSLHRRIQKILRFYHI